MDIAGLLSGPFVRVVLYLLIFWPTVGYYVYRDTKRRETSSPRLKGAVYGFFGIAGVLIYEMQKSTVRERIE